MREVKQVVAMDDFKGYISDLGGAEHAEFARENKNVVENDVEKVSVYCRRR